MKNQVILIGRLGADPETRYSSDGVPICSFRMVTEKKFNRDGEKVVKAEWHRIVTFKKLAEICQTYLQKGSLIFLSGELQTRDYIDKEGVKRFQAEVLAREMIMLGGKKKEQEPDNGGGFDDDDIPF